MVLLTNSWSIFFVLSSIIIIVATTSITSQRPSSVDTTLSVSPSQFLVVHSSFADTMQRVPRITLEQLKLAAKVSLMRCCII